MARIFLSYAHSDSASAKLLAEALGANGHAVWWDENLRGGSRFAAEIDRELQCADVVMVLWSAAAAASPWVLDEAGEGRDSGRLLPIALDGHKPPLGFRQFQAISLPAGGAPDVAISRVVDAIEARSVASGPPRVSEKNAVRSAPRLSICVLPFANIGSDPEHEYFSEGITEDVITDLSRVSALDVIGRNAAFAFRGQSVDEKAIASALGATHVVEGSVRRAGSQVRITAQLIEASTAHQLWAERYDRDLTDIFAIQDEISKAIVEALELTLLPSEEEAINARSTSDAEAYDLYLKARRRWATAGLGNSRAGEDIVSLCREATELDPQYARAWALMALAEGELAFWCGRGEDPLPAAQRAISIDPEIAEAHCVVARQFAEQGSNEGAREEIEAALRIDPDCWEANREAAALALSEGRVGEAIASLERASAAATRTDHESAALLVSLYKVTNDSDGVRRAAELAIASAEWIVISDPRNGAAFASGACGFAAFGHADRSRKWLRKALNTDPGNLAMRYSLATALVTFLGDPEEAMDMLEPFAETMSKRRQLAMLENDPAWAAIRDLPRFRHLVDSARKRIESAPRVAMMPACPAKLPAA